MKWYILNENQEVSGPLSYFVLEEMRTCGAISEATLVCQEGGEDWVTLNDALAVPPKEAKIVLGGLPSEGRAHLETGDLDNSEASVKKTKRTFRRVLIGGGVMVLLVLIGLVVLISAIFNPSDSASWDGDLSEYSRVGDFARVKKLASSQNVNRRGEDGFPLHVAVEGGHSKVVEHLLAMGADWDQSDDFGLFPIHRAAKSGNLKIVGMLVEEGAQVDRVTVGPNAAVQSPGLIVRNRGRQPIHYAAEAGHISIVEELIRLGASPEIEDREGASAIDLVRPLTTEWMKLFDPSGEMLKEYEARIQETSGLVRFDGTYRKANGGEAHSFLFHEDGTVTRIGASSRPAWVDEQLGTTTERTTGKFRIEKGDIVLSFSKRLVNLNGLDQDKFLDSELPGTDIETIFRGTAKGDTIVLTEGDSSTKEMFQFVPNSTE